VLILGEWTMEFNYFNVLSGADKEMMHSAMLKFLFGYDDYFRKNLFSACPSSLDKKSIVTEKVYPGRNRIDVEAQSIDGKYILIIENKFKSFPNKEQLELYDMIYKCDSKNVDKELIKYIICFDEKVISFKHNNDNITTKYNAIWYIITYKRIKECIIEYLKNTNSSLPQDIKLFLGHYITYLNEYYAAYDLVCESYSYAFKPDDNLPRLSEDRFWKLQNVFNKFGTLSIDAVISRLAESRFWQRLILSALGNDFAERCKELKSGQFEPEYDNGSTSVPFLDILPQHWNKVSSPFLFIQLQGKKIKLFMRELPKDKYTAIMDYIIALQNNTPQESGRIRPSIIKRRLERHDKSFMIYYEDIDINVSIPELGQQLWDFTMRMDEVVHKTGCFTGN
jgi:hypothetical protein